MYLCEMDGSDLCEVDNGDLATARSQMPQLPPRFSETSCVAKTFTFLAVSLPKMKKLQPSPSNLVVRPEADSSDPCKADGVELVTAHS